MKWNWKSFNYHPEIHPLVDAALERNKDNSSAFIRKCIEHYEQCRASEMPIEVIAKRLTAIEELLKSGALVINSEAPLPLPLAIEDEAFDDLLSQF